MVRLTPLFRCMKSDRNNCCSLLPVCWKCNMESWNSTHESCMWQQLTVGTSQLNFKMELSCGIPIPMIVLCIALSRRWIILKHRLIMKFYPVQGVLKEIKLGQLVALIFHLTYPAVMKLNRIGKERQRMVEMEAKWRGESAKLMSSIMIASCAYSLFLTKEKELELKEVCSVM